MLLGVLSFQLDHDYYPRLRTQPRCYCGHKKQPGLLTCGHHDIDRTAAAAAERQLGGQPTHYRPRRRTFDHPPGSERRHGHHALRIRAMAMLDDGSLSGNEIARRLGVPRSTLHYWETHTPEALS